MRRDESIGPAGPRAALLALAVLLAPLAGCEDEDPGPPPRALRAAMFEIEFARRDVEPHVRDAARLPTTIASLERIAQWVEDPSFEEWTTLPSFRADASLFAKFRHQLRKATDETLEAARASDLDGLRDGFSRMNMTCIACHKRFQPNY